jgi:uracil-DNA glycosylase
MSNNYAMGKLDFCPRLDCTLQDWCCLLPTELITFNSNKVELMLISQSGGDLESKLKKPFVGASGKRIRSILYALQKDLTLNIGHCYTNTVRACPPKIRVLFFLS